jgi:hypothetical protein
MPDIPADSITTWRLKPAARKPAKPRVRTWQPKTRTGCLTCKHRRVKCDETKPKCLRCVKGNFRCEGYATPKPWLFESGSEEEESASASASSAGPDSPKRQEVLSVPSFWTDELSANEIRALQYFNGRAQPELATFTYAASHFWYDIIPQLYTSNPTIRNAIIAVSSLHELKRTRIAGPSEGATHALYMRSYSQAVQDLTRRGKPPSQEIILMSCLIFLACANLLESAPGVLIHLKAGLKVLREQRDATSPSQTSTADSPSDLLLNYLEPIFARLEAQSSLIPTLARSADFQAYDLNWRAPTLPEAFADLNAARNCMHDVIQYVWYRGKSVDGPIYESHPAYKAFLDQLQQWDDIFTKSFPLHSSPEWPYRRTATALRIHIQALALAFKHEASPDPLWIDTQHEDVARMVSQAEEIILAGLPPAETTTYGMDDIWHHDFCLQPPLLLLGIHVRDPYLRRKALHLKRLHHCWYAPDTEPYLACGSAKMVEMVIDIEQRGPLSQPRTQTTTTPPSWPSPSSSSTSTHSPQSIGTSPSYPTTTTGRTASFTPPNSNLPPLHHRIRPLTVILDLPYKVALSYSRHPHTGPGDTYFESLDVPHWRPPPISRVSLYPFADMIVHGNFQGLIRPQRQRCLCGSLGGPQERMWENAPS